MPSFSSAAHLRPPSTAIRINPPTPSLVDRLERIVGNDVVLAIVIDVAGVVVAAHAHRGLRQVVGAEAEELGLLGDLIGADRGPRHLDHRADEILDVQALLGKDLFGRVADDLLLVLQNSAAKPTSGIMTSGMTVDADFLHVAGGLEDGPGLHPRDLGIDDAQAAAAVAEHRD